MQQEQQAPHSTEQADGHVRAVPSTGKKGAARKGDLLRYTANVIGAAAAIYVLSAAVLRWLCGVVAKAFYGTSANPAFVPEAFQSVLNLLLAAGTLGCALLFLRGVARGPLRVRMSFAMPKEPRIWLFLPVFLGAGVVCNMATSLLQGWLPQVSGYVAPQSVRLPQSGPATFGYFLAMCVVPAVLEEIFVRGYVQKLLARWGVWFAVIVSSALFTLLHGDIAQMPATFLLSLLLGLVAYTTGSLLPGITLHFVNNLTAFLVLLADQKAEGTLGVGLVAYLMMAYCVAGAVGIWLIHEKHLLRMLRPVPRPAQPQHRKRRLMRLVCAPMFSGMMIWLAVRAVLPLLQKR